MKKALVVGGANGIGLAISHCLACRSDVETVYVVDKVEMSDKNMNRKFHSEIFDLQSSDFSFFDKYEDIDLLMITAGFGKLALFADISETLITNSFTVNTIAPIRLIHHFYNRLQSDDNF